MFVNNRIIKKLKIKPFFGLIGALLLFISVSLKAQQGQWTWMSGPNLFAATPGAPVFGTQGIASPDNLPAVVGTATTWVDQQGNFWLLGGDGGMGGGFFSASNNLWKYDPDILQWTWMKGTGSMDNVFPYQMAIYGTQGIAADSVTPLGNHEGHDHHVAWTGNDGNLWLLESDDISGNCAMWKYTIATNQWTWMQGNIPANYGAQGVSSPLNNPEKFFGNPSKGWVDEAGDLWYFDGVNGGVMWKYSLSNNQWIWMSGTPNTAGTGTFSPIVYGTKGVFNAANQPGSCSVTQTWTACDGTFYMFGPLWTNSNTVYNGNSISVMWRFDPNLNQWAWVGGNTTLNFIPQFDANYATFPSNFDDACNFDPAYFPVNAVQFLGPNNAWTGRDGRLYGYQQSESFLWCYDPAINEFALVHGDLAPCCDFNALTAGFTSVLGTLGVPSPDNSPGAVGGPSWVDLDGNFWKFGSIPFDLNEITTFNFYGPMMRFTPNPDCLGSTSLAIIDSVSEVACTMYTTPLGDVYTESGQYSYTLPGNKGCEKSVVLDLTIIQPVSSVQYISSCGAYTAATGEVFTESVIFNYTVPAVNGCDSIVSVNLTIVESADNTLIIPDSYNILQGDSVQLQVGGAVSYQWLPSTGLNCDTCATVWANPEGTTSYTIIATDSAGCARIDTVIVEVDIRCGELFIPSIFSPNGKGPQANETFCVFSDCVDQFKLVIYNRWGEKVFETEDINTCWDGTFNGSDAATGAYAYNLFLVQLDGVPVNKKGTIMLAK
jgi:gliding motility-associated-like protein